MIRWFDRGGVQIDVDTYAALLADADYKRVARSVVTDAADTAKALDVSTVWLGLDHNFSGWLGSDVRLPLIFETMVFGDGSDEFATARYSTEAEAMEGHAAMVVSICATYTDPVVMDAVGVKQPEDGKQP